MEFLVQLIFILFFPSVQAGDIAGLNFFKQNPQCHFEKNYLYLSKEKAVELGLSRMIRRYDITCKSAKYVGYVLDDKIRTHFQNLFVVLAGKEIIDVEVVQFSEPQQYSASNKWVEYFFVKKKIDELAIDTISGATLTTQSYKRIFKKILELSQ